MGEDSEQIDETEEPAAVLRFITRLRGVSEGERFTGEPITSHQLVGAGWVVVGSRLEHVLQQHVSADQTWF